jgi:putative Holliday junction resolvase
VRVVGIDLGSRRIGVAVSDATGTLASPYEVVARNDGSHAAIKRIVEEVEAERVVVGLPLSLDGSDGPAAKAARAEAVVLQAALGVPVELYDERLTTVTANRSMMDLKMKADARKRVVDKVAAAVMLQSWLESQP